MHVPVVQEDLIREGSRVVTFAAMARAGALMLVGRKKDDCVVARPIAGWS
jgi:hypothetical protein